MKIISNNNEKDTFGDGGRGRGTVTSNPTQN